MSSILSSSARADYHPIAQVHLSGVPEAMAVDDTLHRVYVVTTAGQNPRYSDFPNYTLSILDSMHNTVLKAVDLSLLDDGYVYLGSVYLEINAPIAINSTTHQIYLYNVLTSVVYVLDGRTGALSHTIRVQNGQYVNLAVNPTTNKIYVSGGDIVNIIDGNTYQIKNIHFNSGAGPVAVNTKTNRIYIVQGSSIDIIDGITDMLINTIYLPQIQQIGFVVVNSAQNRIYVACSPNSYDITQLDVLDGATNRVLGSSSFIPDILRIDENTDTLYGLETLGPFVITNEALTVINGAARQASTPIPYTPLADAITDIEVDAATGHLFAADTSLNTVDVLANASAIYSISGYVTTPSGAPIANLTVLCNGQKPLQTQTDSHGYYSFSGLFGLYTVQPADATVQPSTLTQYTFNPASHVVNLENGSARHIDFTGLIGFSLSGRVINTNGIGLFSVAITASSDDNAHAATVYTNGSGYYGFSGLPPAALSKTIYTLTPQSNRYGFVPSALISSPRGGYPATNLDFTAYAAPYILGRVTSQQPFKLPFDPHIVLTGTESDGTRIAQETTLTIVRDGLLSTHGEFGFGALPPGTYTITPTAHGYVFDPPTATVTISATRNTPNVAFTVAPLSSVTFSSSLAQSSTDAVTLRFTGALDATGAADAAHYQVQINGQNVSVESASYNDVNHTVTLGFALDTLHKGDKMQVSATGLQDSTYRGLNPIAVNLVAQ